MGEYVLDCVRVEPSEWWVGYHRVHSFGSQWPGGLLSLELPADAVSRAWLKMEESLRGRNCRCGREIVARRSAVRRGERVRLS